MVSKRVLIIDDEMDSCLLLKSFLSQLGYEVHTALTLKEGLASLDNFSPAFVFLDNNLPDGLGWDHIDHIQSKLPMCKLILVSAYHFDIHTLHGKSVEVMEKPISLSKIKKFLS